MLNQALEALSECDLKAKNKQACTVLFRFVI